jgi:hypothetical protein
MFDSIKQALTSSPKSGGVGDILRTTVGNSYEVRLLPCVKNPDKTFYHYYAHGWTSFATGQYVNAISPTTWGERDPISEIRYQHYRSGSPAEKEKCSNILRSEKWLVNAYIVKDPVNPENNGTIKVVRFGKQLHKIIMDAIEGDDADQFGARIFDLSKNGCNFRIRVDKQGDFPSYVTSRFLMPSEIADLDQAKAQEQYDNVHDLEEVLPKKSFDELKKMVDEHYLCVDSMTSQSAPATEEVTEPVTKDPDPEVTEEVPWNFDKSSKKESDSTDDSIDDETIKELLDGLDD